MNLLSTGIMSLSVMTSEVVEVSAERLTQLERLAGFGRLSLIAILIAVAFVILHFYIKARVAEEVRKTAKAKMKYIAEVAAEKAIADACNYGEIYEAINKEIEDSCSFGDVYKLVKHGTVTKYTPIEIDEDLGDLEFDTDGRLVR